MLLWMFIGLVAGLVANQSRKKRGEVLLGEGFLREICLGVSGALGAGLIYGTIGVNRAEAFDLIGVAIATLGAIAVLAAHHAVVRKREAKEAKW